MSSTAGPHPVYVLATTPAGTSEALREAARQAGTDRHVVLLVPVLISAGGGRTASARMEEAAAIARAAGVAASAYAFVCQRPHDVFLWFPVGDATVIVGGQPGTPEAGLAETLGRDGHHVIVAPTEDRVPS